MVELASLNSVVDRQIVHAYWNRDCSWLDERTNLNNVVGTRGNKGWMKGERGEGGREGEREGGREGGRREGRDEGREVEGRGEGMEGRKKGGREVGEIFFF